MKTVLLVVDGPSGSSPRAAVAPLGQGGQPFHLGRGLPGWGCWQTGPLVAKAAVQGLEPGVAISSPSHMLHAVGVGLLLLVWVHFSPECLAPGAKRQWCLLCAPDNLLLHLKHSIHLFVRLSVPLPGIRTVNYSVLATKH